MGDLEWGKVRTARNLEGLSLAIPERGACVELEGKVRTWPEKDGVAVRIYRECRGSGGT